MREADLLGDGIDVPRRSHVRQERRCGSARARSMPCRARMRRGNVRVVAFAELDWIMRPRFLPRHGASRLSPLGLPHASSQSSRLVTHARTPATDHRAIPTGDRWTVIEAVRALAPDVRAQSERIERDRRLPLDLVRSLARIGVFRLCVPRALAARGRAATLLAVLEAVACRRLDGMVRVIGATAAC
jgi:hypothetical protein